MNNSQINFKANHIKTVTILQRQGSKYEPVTAQFVRMEQKNSDDYRAIESIYANWKNADFTYDILEGMKSFRFDLFNRLHIFALTKQQDHFEKLDPDKILGVVKFTEHSDRNTLDYIQVKPNNTNAPWHFFKKPEYKHVGKSMLDSLKSIFNNKPMELFSNGRSISFYLRNKFKYSHDKGGNNMWWYPTSH